MTKLALALFGVFALGVAGDALARDRGADGRFEKRTSSHFALYQDVDIDRTSGLHGTRNFENQVLDVLERAYDELDEYLALRPRRRLDVVVYDPTLFDVQYAPMFRFRAAGFYSGTIHVRGGVRVDAPLVGTLSHELVHAAFDAEAPTLTLPAWFNEGIAEWFEARTIGKSQLSAGEFRAMTNVAGRNALLPFAQLSNRSFAGFDQNAASVAYLQSYAFFDFLSHEFGERSLRRLCATLLRKRDVERALQETYRAGLAGLEGGFVAYYREHAGS